MKSIFGTVILLCIPLVLGAQIPEITHAEVTLPYSELKELIDAAGKGTTRVSEPKPPLDASLMSAHYRLDLAGSVPALTAEFKARTFTKEWHRVLLLGGDTRLGGSETADPESSIVRQERDYVLLARGEGEFTATCSLTFPDIDTWQQGGGFLFSPAPATVGELRVTGLPAGKAIRIDGQAPARTIGGEMIFSLPGEREEWRIVLEEETTDSDALAILPSAWELHSQILVRYSDGRLRHSARIQAQADSGSGLSVVLALPSKVGGVSVEGEDFETWKLDPRGAESRLLRIQWKTRDVLDRTFFLNWEIPQSPLAETWDLVPPQVRHDEVEETRPTPTESRSLIALIPVEGMELAHPALREVAESRRLPEWLREQLGTEDGLTAEITGETPISLAASWLPRLETAQATVSRARCETRLVADGSMLVTADYTVQHTAPIHWTLDLPSIDQILTCEINHRPASPIRRGENQIEFRLTTPLPQDNEVPATTVHLSYSLKSDALDPVSGRVALELPLTELFIHRLDWTLSLPAGYEPTAVEGNVQISPAQSASSSTTNLIHLEKELCRGERPAVEIHYQSKGLSPDS